MPTKVSFVSSSNRDLPGTYVSGILGRMAPEGAEFNPNLLAAVALHSEHQQTEHSYNVELRFIARIDHKRD
jgi:hypothetical protein